MRAQRCWKQPRRGNGVLQASAEEADVAPGNESNALEDLRAEVELLKQELTKTREIIRGLLDPRPTRFLTLRTIGQLLGLGTVRTRQLIAAGSLRTVPFPNGAIRVPRSELEKLTLLGRRQWDNPAETRPSPEAPRPGPTPASREFRSRVLPP